MALKTIFSPWISTFINNLTKNYSQNSTLTIVKTTTRKRSFTRGKKCHHNLINDNKKGLHHQKLYVTIGNIAKSKRDMEMN